jgi:hypothetical protein
MIVHRFDPEGSISYAAPRTRNVPLAASEDVVAVTVADVARLLDNFSARDFEALAEAIDSVTAAALTRGLARRSPKGDR